VRFVIHSEGNRTEFEPLQREFGVQLVLDGPAGEAWLDMVNADILVISPRGPGAPHAPEDESGCIRCRRRPVPGVAWRRPRRPVPAALHACHAGLVAGHVFRRAWVAVRTHQRRPRLPAQSHAPLSRPSGDRKEWDVVHSGPLQHGPGASRAISRQGAPSVPSGDSLRTHLLLVPLVVGSHFQVGPYGTATVPHRSVCPGEHSIQRIRTERGSAGSPR